MFTCMMNEDGGGWIGDRDELLYMWSDVEIIR